jgi:hypothetical protein
LLLLYFPWLYGMTNSFTTRDPDYGASLKEYQKLTSVSIQLQGHPKLTPASAGSGGAHGLARKEQRTVVIRSTDTI